MNGLVCIWYDELWWVNYIFGDGCNEWFFFILDTLRIIFGFMLLYNDLLDELLYTDISLLLYTHRDISLYLSYCLLTVGVFLYVSLLNYPLLLL